MANFSIIGDVHRVNHSPSLSGALDVSLFGDLTLDFTRTPLSPGEHTLRILTLIGDITLQFPGEVAVHIEGMGLISDTRVPDRRPELPSARAGDEGFSDQKQPSIHVTVQVFRLIGDVRVEYLPTTPPQEPKIQLPLLEEQTPATTTPDTPIPQYRQR